VSAPIPGTRKVAETPSQADLDALSNNPVRVEQWLLRLLHEWAVAACLVDVDLNPIRAGLANEVRHSEHTAVFARLSATMTWFIKPLPPDLQQDYGREAEGVTGAPATRGVGFPGYRWVLLGHVRSLRDRQCELKPLRRSTRPSLY
jgi:hypothetical protein